MYRGVSLWWLSGWLLGTPAPYHQLETFTPDGRTNKHWNVVFGNITIYITVYGKMPDKHLNFFVVFQSKGQGPNSCWKYGTNLSHSFPFFKYLVPLIGKERYIAMLLQHFLWTLIYMIMLGNCRNNIQMTGYSSIQGTSF